MEKKYLVGITGASGAIYALTLIEKLRDLGLKVEVIITKTGKEVWEYELGKPWLLLKEYVEVVYEETDISAPPASGSSSYAGLIIIPCSMGTLAGLATGQARNLLLRAGDVMLKERKPLLLVVRETPLSFIHLQNMLNVTLAGGIIFPAMPSFYNKPKDLGELINDFIDRLLQFLGIVSNSKSWQGFRT
ncbi:MAG: UbiX family flavin prenyltransferase, partial [Caldimicrobium sp.]